MEVSGFATGEATGFVVVSGSAGVDWGSNSALWDAGWLSHLAHQILEPGKLNPSGV